MTTSEATYYVYVLFRPDGTPCYVGKGKGYRWSTHFGKSHNRHLANIVAKAGGSLPVVRVREHLTEAVALETEAALIGAIGRSCDGSGPLVNLTDGGDRGGLSGYNHTDITKGKIAAGHVGRQHTSETKVKCGIANIGRIPTDIARANMSNGQKGRPPKSAKERAGISARQLGVPRSAETKAKISATRLERKIIPSTEAREKMSASGRLRGPRSAEVKAKIAAGSVLREARKRAARASSMGAAISERPPPAA